MTCKLRGLSMTLFALLLIQAFGSLIYTVDATRGTSLQSVSQARIGKGSQMDLVTNTHMLDA